MKSSNTISQDKDRSSGQRRLRCVTTYTIYGQLDTPLLAPPLDLPRQFLPLIAHHFHHRLHLLLHRRIVREMPVRHDPGRLLRCQIRIVDRNHQIHHRRQLVWKPLHPH